MNKLTVVAFCLLACLYASFAAAETATPNPDLASADWSVKQAHKLNSESKETVWKFLNNLWRNDDLIVGKLCEFRFADLRHSGELSLVVSYDAGGTADCNCVDIFEKCGAGIKDYDFQTPASSYFDSVEDINRDGNHQLVVYKVFASGGQPTGHCGATWPVIYAWTGTGYSDVSSHYKSYYKQQLVSLKKEIAATDSSADDCTKAEAAKIERFLGLSRNAGLSDAIEWAASDDFQDRLFAIDVLSEIGTPKAIEQLRTLSRDPDRTVARDAKYELESVTDKPVENPMVRGELVVRPPRRGTHHHRITGS